MEMQRFVTAHAGRARRSLADMVSDIERDAPEAVAARGLSSAAMRAGDLVRACRKAAGLTQSELASLMDMDQGQLSRLEAGMGTHGPTWDVMERVAAACGGRLTAVATPDRATVERVHAAMVGIGMRAGAAVVVERDGVWGLSVDVDDGMTQVFLSVQVTPAGSRTGQGANAARSASSSGSAP